jgi:class 3 adenylate cyclase/TolB-like protein
LARDHRRLSAIVSADVVGYSRLMGRDEGGTLARLKAHLRDLIDPKIAEYGGRTVKSMGDGLLLEFPSVVDAVRCSVDVQRGMAERNAGIPEDDQIRFRVGINVGDIIIDGDDIFGDGVNVAARLQTLAEPGGICVSRAVRDHVLDKLSFAFEELGAQQVKNIARPIEVFRIHDAPDGHVVPVRASPLARTRLTLRRNWRAAVAAAVVVAAACVALWTFVLQPQLAPDATRAARAGPRPFRSIAVLPFTAASNTAEEERLARDLTREFTGLVGKRMSLVNGLVVSHGLVQQYSQQTTDPRKLGTALNVRYVLEGEVRQKGEVRELAVTLVDAVDGTHLWQAHEDLPAGDPADALARLALKLVVPIHEATRKEVAGLPKADQEKWALMFRFQDLPRNAPDVGGRTASASERQRLLEEALRLDPNFVFGLIQLQGVLRDRLLYEPEHRGELLKQLEDVSARAVALAGNDARVLNQRAGLLGAQGNWTAALATNDKARRLDPFSPTTTFERGWLLNYAGRPGEALAEAARAKELGGGQENVADLRCSAYLYLQRFAEAIPECEVAATRRDWIAYAKTAAAYANAGNSEKATAWGRKALEANPTLTVSNFVLRYVSTEPAYLANLEPILSGLRRAGIPEQ